jgi:hypothetical protein
MHYIFVAYTYDLNTILVCTMPSKNDAAMITTFTNILATLAACRYTPTLNATDNECSKMVEACIKSNKVDIHLVPPHNHHVNATKCLIATFKEHFIMGLATVNRNCPLQLWDKFLQQVELTLNLLCFSCRDPSKSANKEVNRFFYLKKTPIAPIETKSLIYVDPAIHASWAPHGTDAFYSGSAPKHYWCLQFCMPTTHCCCIIDSWQLYPSHCMIPTVSTADHMDLAACNVLRTLQSTIPTTAIEAANCSTAIQNVRAIISPILLPVPHLQGWGLR